VKRKLPQRPGRREYRRRSHVRQVEGTLQVHPDGFGFVRPRTQEGEDIYIPAREAQRALDGDEVLVEVPNHGRVSGRLVKVLERTRQWVVGTYLDRAREAVVLPRERNLPKFIRVPRTPKARDGEPVRVRLRSEAALLERGRVLAGEVVDSLADVGDTYAEVLSIAYAHGFADEFPRGVISEALRIPAQVREEEAGASGRRDLRQIPLVTIDGEDARDFDDAVYAEPHPQGWRLVVAIADVAHYVREGRALDEEALNRGTSVYLPAQVLPMLPERLSNGICSLRPEEDRLCLAADMIFGPKGKMISSELYPGVMRSAARYTYRQVQDFLDGKQTVELATLRKSLESLNQLAIELQRMREQRGAIDFDLPETRVVLDPEGKPRRMERRQRLQSHRLIEEAMLAANEAVAKFFQDHELPTIYRYHGEPDEEKLQEFAQLANAHGFRLGGRGEISSRDLNVFLEKLEGHPERRALNQLLLRSMMQAIYSAEEVGHYGLGAEHYLHFTSPIRRYPDLIVHRMLKAHWDGGSKKMTPRQRRAESGALAHIAAKSSERERAAIQVEREVTAFYTALLMRGRIGEEFAATISSLADFGVFVELDDLWIEGLVKAETLGPDFRFDKRLYMVVASRSKLRLRVGQKVRVRLVSVNIRRRQIDFELAREFERHERKR
jgi:ribonuclease R